MSTVSASGAANVGNVGARTATLLSTASCPDPVRVEAWLILLLAAIGRGLRSGKARAPSDDHRIDVDESI